MPTPASSPSPAPHPTHQSATQQPQQPTPTRTILTPSTIARLALGWLAYLALPFAPSTTTSTTPTLFALLALIIAVIVVCAGGVAHQAERLALRLGDPYGTLVLTLSIMTIEVVLISAVMLGPGDHPTIARDSVMAASMIVLTLVIGLALLVGGLRHSNLRVNRTGISAYLSMLVVLIATVFTFPVVVGSGGAYGAGQAVPIVVLVVVLYVFFLCRQTGAQRADFQEVAGDRPVSYSSTPPLKAPLRHHKSEVLTRILLLIFTAVPIVLLSHDMAALLDDGLGRIGAPLALSGVIIAMIVFLPEGITTIRAAWGGEGQRMVNLAHGALVSCLGLTLPVVLVIGLLTGQTVVLAESPTNLLLLCVSLMLNVATFSAKRLTALHGAAHLFVFCLYGLSVFA